MWYRNSDFVEWAAVLSILFSLGTIYIATVFLRGDAESHAIAFRTVMYAPAAAIAVAAGNYARRNITRRLPSEREHTLPGAVIVIGLPVLYGLVALILVSVAASDPGNGYVDGYFTTVTTIFSGFYVPVAIQTLSPRGGSKGLEDQDGANPEPAA